MLQLNNYNLRELVPIKDKYIGHSSLPFSDDYPYIKSDVIDSQEIVNYYTLMDFSKSATEPIPIAIVVIEKVFKCLVRNGTTHEANEWYYYSNPPIVINVQKMY